MKPDQPSFLYVEDDFSCREIMEILIKDIMGFSQLTIFDNSANFTERLLKLPIPDIIFLDIHVKPHNGFDMFDMIKKTPVFEKSIVVAVTASVMSNEVERLRLVGFKNLVGKPINPESFPRKVKDILSGKEVWDASWET
jgi:CheY-like chemotaxis protein